MGEYHCGIRLFFCHAERGIFIRSVHYFQLMLDFPESFFAAQGSFFAE
jgi:hypothetical protein